MYILLANLSSVAIKMFVIFLKNSAINLCCTNKKLFSKEGVPILYVWGPRARRFHNVICSGWVASLKPRGIGPATAHLRASVPTLARPWAMAWPWCHILRGVSIHYTCLGWHRFWHCPVTTSAPHQLSDASRCQHTWPARYLSRIKPTVYLTFVWWPGATLARDARKMICLFCTCSKGVLLHCTLCNRTPFLTCLKHIYQPWVFQKNILVSPFSIWQGDHINGDLVELRLKPRRATVCSLFHIVHYIILSILLCVMYWFLIEIILFQKYSEIEVVRVRLFVMVRLNQAQSPKIE